MSLVSIVVTLNDAEAGIARCLASLVAQTHAEIEIVCVNMRTVDNSATLVRAAMADDNRIRLLNEGISVPFRDPRAAGIADARGSYLLLLDGRDRLVPDAVETCLRVSEERNAGCVAFAIRADEPSQPEKPAAAASVRRLAEGGVIDLTRHPDHLADLPRAACCFMWRRHTVEQAGARFSDLRSRPDERFVLNCALQAGTVALVDDVLLRRGAPPDRSCTPLNTSPNEELREIRAICADLSQLLPDEGRRRLEAHLLLTACAGLLAIAGDETAPVIQAAKPILRALSRADLCLWRPAGLSFPNLRVLLGDDPATADDETGSRGDAAATAPGGARISRLGAFEAAWTDPDTLDVRFGSDWNDLKAGYAAPLDLSTGFLRAFVRVVAEEPLLLRFAFLCASRRDDPADEVNSLEHYCTFPPGINEVVFQASDMWVQTGDPDPCRVHDVLLGGHPGPGEVALTLAHVRGDEARNLLSSEIAVRRSKQFAAPPLRELATSFTTRLRLLEDNIRSDSEMPALAEQGRRDAAHDRRSAL